MTVVNSRKIQDLEKLTLQLSLLVFLHAFHYMVPSQDTTVLKYSIDTKLQSRGYFLLNSFSVEITLLNLLQHPKPTFLQTETCCE